MIPFYTYALTVAAPVYLKYSFTTEPEIIRLSEYMSKIDKFEQRVTWRCLELSSAGKSKTSKLSVVRNDEQGITQTQMHRDSGVPLITCRRDLDKIQYWYHQFHVAQRFGIMKHPPTE